MMSKVAYLGEVCDEVASLGEGCGEQGGRLGKGLVGEVAHLGEMLVSGVVRRDPGQNGYAFWMVSMH
ncbi:hypothetical protein CYMTET_39533 [Cymbomonas tetramitiformis]|uniref:Uncharacterized protein n=1 Tax=Cymbomonas tetramitiformis TaxID=36881 RepID=A0AAE0CBK8_9CHLO|nr:hypothetical protein CYMTET_39533 [Cymbomonas tetramitiformis]